jgi:hypothetical protein
MIPTGTLGVAVHVRAWVPVDDEHVMYWSMNVPQSRAVGRGGQAGNERNAASGRPIDIASNGRRPAGFEYEPFTSDWLGQWRLTQTAANDYLIDRQAQQTGVNYTGIAGIFQQDQAVTESMGRIYDRSHEHLGTSDSMVIRTRRRLISAARSLRDRGETPPGVDDPAVYRTRSGSVILPRSASWLEATQAARWPKVAIGEPVRVGV